jgi:peptidoglycan/xylan/chitin deacetylase (PgdA/CDA1 family)
VTSKLVGADGCRVTGRGRTRARRAGHLDEGGLSPVPAVRRDLANESFFEYGSRAGVWRLFRIFKKHQVRCTFFACAVALERNPAVGPAITAEGHDILAHGNRCPRLQRTA